MYGPGGLSLRSLAAAAALEGLCQISDVALLNRLGRASAWLSALCCSVLARERAAGPAPASSDPSRPIRIVDSSRLEGPGKQAWRLHLAFDPAAGRGAGARLPPLAPPGRRGTLPPPSPA